MLMDDLDSFLSLCYLSQEERTLARDIYFMFPNDWESVTAAWKNEPSLKAIGDIYGWDALLSEPKNIITAFMPIPGVLVNIETPKPLDIIKEINVYLAYNQPNRALVALGQAIDVREIGLDKAQDILRGIAPEANLDRIAKEYKPRWWQFSGWEGILKRYGKCRTE
jgi:hypothetical protein